MAASDRHLKRGTNCQRGSTLRRHGSLQQQKRWSAPFVERLLGATLQSVGTCILDPYWKLYKYQTQQRTPFYSQTAAVERPWYFRKYPLSSSSLHTLHHHRSSRFGGHIRVNLQPATTFNSCLTLSTRFSPLSQQTLLHMATPLHFHILYPPLFRGLWEPITISDLFASSRSYRSTVLGKRFLLLFPSCEEEGGSLSYPRPEGSQEVHMLPQLQDGNTSGSRPVHDSWITGHILPCCQPPSP